MKNSLQLLASLLCLGGLLGGLGTAQATDVTRLPLNAGVLAKPNVIFAQDDSGSMDWEFMVISEDGIPMWDYANGRGHNNGDVLRKGGVGHWGYFYLFPNGAGPGNRLYPDPDPSYGYALPPTRELAWGRNKEFNTLYYNPYVTYRPWSSAVVNGAALDFSAADPAQARSHPVNGSSTYRLDADMNVNADGWRFSFMAGMTIPAGAVVHSCVSGGIPVTLPYTVPSSQTACSASMSFYPATYWMKAGDPGVPTCVVETSDCAPSPKPGEWLRRFEIKPGNTFPTGRSYAAEMQNFANWFTYQRKRRLMLAGAMGAVLDGITGLRIGVVNFNDNQPVTMYDIDAADGAPGRQHLIGTFYTPERQAGTPTRETLLYIGEQFRRTDKDAQGRGNVIQYACQRNNAFIVTDGYAFPSVVKAPDYNKSSPYINQDPYTQIHISTLGEIAAGLFVNNPRPDLALGKIKPEAATLLNADLNTNQHVNVHGLTLGLTGEIWPANTNPFVTLPKWPNPVKQAAEQIDDLWHATLIGRGQMYLANTPQETAEKIQAALTVMLNKPGAQTGVAVSSVNLGKGDGQAYLATYNPVGWDGDITARPISGSTGEVGSTVTWSAADLLKNRPWAERNIVAFDGSSLKPFTAAAVGALVNPGNAYGNTTDVMAYLKGDRSLEGSVFRTRDSLLGAVINAEPTVDDGVVFAATGEGMLHAFETRAPNAGKELWAFVPRASLDRLGQTSRPGYTFANRLDGSPVVANVNGNKLLVAGMGTAGRSFYALGAANPRSLTEGATGGRVAWEFPGTAEASHAPAVGLAMGRPVVVKVRDGGAVVTAVLVTSGYNNADGKGRLWMLDAGTGKVLKQFITSVGSTGAEVGLAQVSPFGEADGTVRYVYGGDLLGNLWRFDLAAADGSAPVSIATLKGPGGVAQPVTSAPELLWIDSRRVVVVGTGRLLGSSDFGNTAVQTIYAISDPDATTPLNNPRSTLVQQVHSRAGNTMTSNSVDWATQRGWYLDLPAGEQITGRPVMAYGAIGFVTNSNGAVDCTAQSFFYWVSVLGHRVTPDAVVSEVLSNEVNASRLTAVLTSEGARFVVRTGDDKTKTTKPLPYPKIKPSKNAWREVRR